MCKRKQSKFTDDIDPNKNIIITKLQVINHTYLDKIKGEKVETQINSRRQYFKYV